MYTVKRTVEFDDWLASTNDGMTRIRLSKRLDKAHIAAAIALSKTIEE